ncbi:hypothetical protein UY3_18261 [Chelonia mydas]|uniref:Uncharacterized protein n=1 Tax=Chelonia mydas TaxID=8469 RepID=M7AK09_CHEMY|nr:hypothetical protein UY3_18261 [Chelonia mydas]
MDRDCDQTLRAGQVSCTTASGENTDNQDPSPPPSMAAELQTISIDPLYAEEPMSRLFANANWFISVKVNEAVPTHPADNRILTMYP